MTDAIRTLYASFATRLGAMRRRLGRDLTLAEKILFTHLDHAETADVERGKGWIDLRPDRVAMQDATAQMALLQFMQAGRKRVAVPTTVHCDHLIRARVGAADDMQVALRRERRGLPVSCARRRRSTASASGTRAPASSTRWCSRTTRSPAA